MLDATYRSLAGGASWSGNEANHLFLGVPGEGRFVELSGLSGLDDRGDSRAFGTLDFDRDGWMDVALGNVSEPRFRLFENRSAGRLPGERRGFVAVRLVGGNDRPEPSDEWSVRDAIGSRLRFELGSGRAIHRELRRDDGFKAQHTRTLLVGIGGEEGVHRVVVEWPSGRTQEVLEVAAGTLLTCYEDPRHSPEGTQETREAYTRASKPPRAVADRPATRLHLGEGRHGEEGLTLYTTMSTSCVQCTLSLADVRALRRSFDDDEVTILGVPVATKDTEEDLRSYERVYAPAYRLLVDLSEEEIERVRSIVSRILHTPAESTPATIVTDATGSILATSWGVPTISELRRIRALSRAE